MNDKKYNAYQYDFSINNNLGKLFPQDFGVKAPMYIGVSESFKNPQYNPLDPDILFSTSLKTLETKEERDSLKYIAQDYVVEKSIKFYKRKKDESSKKGEKPKKQKVYDIENWTLSYSKKQNINPKY